MKYKSCVNPSVVNVGIKWSDVKNDWVDKLYFNKVANIKKKYYVIPCGKCIACMYKYSQNWALRLSHEAQLHKESCFITLTYNENNLPKNATLDPVHLKRFIDRLSKYIKRKENKDICIRYFSCGEYGDKEYRPNYHIAVFGWVPKDLRYFKNTIKQTALYLSSIVEKIWGNGFISVGLDMSSKALIYLTKYMTKLQKWNKKNKAPFVRMSNRPGIGAGWLAEYRIDGRKIVYTKFKRDVYTTDLIYDNGFTKKPPKYYDRIAEKLGVDVKAIKQKRQNYYIGQLPKTPTPEKIDQYIRSVYRDGYTLDHMFPNFSDRIDDIEKREEYNVMYKSVILPLKINQWKNKIYYISQKQEENNFLTTFFIVNNKFVSPVYVKNNI